MQTSNGKLDMFVVASRFTEKTWQENCAYREKRAARGRPLGCVYGSPLPMANSIPYKAPVFVLEMNFAQHKIMGIGLVKNDCLVDGHRIYSDTQYNVCSYDGKYRVDREEMTRKEEDLMERLDEMLFWQSKIWRTRNGLTQIPKWVRETEDLNYEAIIKNMFVSRYRDGEKQSSTSKEKIVIRVKKARPKLRPCARA